MEEAKELSSFEKAALKIAVRRLGSDDLLQVMHQAEPGWSTSTYYRRLEDARASLERKGLLTRVVNRSIQDWQVNREAFRYYSQEQILEEYVYLSRRAMELEASSSDLAKRNSDLQRELEIGRKEQLAVKTELDYLRNEHRESLQERLNARFPKLKLNGVWVEALVLVALVEVMARYKMNSLEKGEEEDKKFTELLTTLQELIPEKEGRSFDFNKDLVKALYDFRNKMIHSGLTTNVRVKEVEGIASLVEDLYQQMFETQ